MSNVTLLNLARSAWNYVVTLICKLTRHCLYLQEQVREDILQRMLTKFNLICRNEAIDLDYLLDVAQQELALAINASNHVNIPDNLIRGLQELINFLNISLNSEETSGNAASEFVSYTWGNVGRPPLEISRDDLKELLSAALPVETLAQLCGVSRRTMNRRLKEQSLSVRGCYSSISDNELDSVVRSIKIRTPHAGYRLVKGELLAYNGTG